MKLRTRVLVWGYRVTERLRDWWRGYTYHDYVSVRHKLLAARCRGPGAVVEVEPSEMRALRAMLRRWRPGDPPFSWHGPLRLYPDTRKVEILDGTTRAGRDSPAGAPRSGR